MANHRPFQATDEKKRLTERIRDLFSTKGDEDMGQRFLIRLTAFAVAMALVVLGAGVAWADQINGDADSDAVASPHGNSVSANQAEGTTVAYSLSALIKETGNDNDDVFDGPSDSVTVTIGRSGDWLNSTDGGSNFASAFTSYDASQSGTIRITVPACTAVGTTKIMTVQLTGTASNGRAIQSDSLTYTITSTAGTSTCSSSDTTAPTPVSISINDGDAWTNSSAGTVSLDFSASDNVGIAGYKLAESQAGLAGTPTAVSPAEASFSRTDQSFTLTAPEGSSKEVWLKVCDAAGNCAEASDTIGWDKTAPNAPTATPDRAAEYDGATPLDPADDWWMNTVTVNFASNGDPGGAAASGVNAATLSASETFTTTGTHSTVGGFVDDNAGNKSLRGGLTVKVDAAAPTVSFDANECPATLTKGSTASADWTASDVGSGLSSNQTGSVSLPTNAVGQTTVYAPQATDNVGLTSSNTTAGTCTYSVVYDWTGFFRPIDNDGVYNKVKAGSAVPVKFSLGGDQGLSIFGTGTNNETTFSYPTSRVIECDSTGEVDAVEETVTAGSSSLSYDAGMMQYTYVWKTEKGWANSCRQLVVKLNDGTIKRANFKFTK